MSDELLVRKASPTLAGLKTGNLFPCAIESREEFLKSLRRLNGLLGPKGLRLVPVRMDRQNALLYLYRPQMLLEDLRNETARRILARQGYPQDESRCLPELIRRMRGTAFPHEIGLFLGYPAEDVEGFIVQQGHNAKLVGTWKVYGDVTAARRRFALYQKCTRVYGETYRKTHCVEKLTVCRKDCARCPQAEKL